MQIRTIYPFTQPDKRSFSIQEAESMLPIFMVISKKTRKEINLYNAQLAYFKGQSSRCDQLQNKIEQSLQKWSEKISKLGGIPLSQWKVQIPSSEHDFYWEFPQDKITPIN